MPNEQLVTRELLAALPLPGYGPNASKFDRGKLFLVAGSAALPGAALLAGRAALRVGCGTVRLLLPADLAPHAGMAFPEAMVLPISPEQVRRQYAVCRAGVVGPGLDGTDKVARLVRKLVGESPVPLVVDAEALLACVKTPTSFAGPRVFTPHAGEMCRLLGCDADALEADRVDLALGFARDRRATVVLKGKETLIAGPDGALYVDRSGTRALATAGSGDSLAGVIGGLLAQGLDATAAAVWGVHLHGLAGEAAGADLGDDGVLASDFVDRLPRVIRDLRRATA